MGILFSTILGNDVDYVELIFKQLRENDMAELRHNEAFWKLISSLSQNPRAVSELRLSVVSILNNDLDASFWILDLLFPLPNQKAYKIIALSIMKLTSVSRILRSKLFYSIILDRIFLEKLFFIYFSSVSFFSKLSQFFTLGDVRRLLRLVGSSKLEIIKVLKTDVEVLYERLLNVAWNGKLEVSKSISDYMLPGARQSMVVVLKILRADSLWNLVLSENCAELLISRSFTEWIDFCRIQVERFFSLLSTIPQGGFSPTLVSSRHKRMSDCIHSFLNHPFTVQFLYSYSIKEFLTEFVSILYNDGLRETAVVDSSYLKNSLKNIGKIFPEYSIVNLFYSFLVLVSILQDPIFSDLCLQLFCRPYYFLELSTALQSDSFRVKSIISTLLALPNWNNLFETMKNHYDLVSSILELALIEMESYLHLFSDLNSNNLLIEAHSLRRFLFHLNSFSKNSNYAPFMQILFQPTISSLLVELLDMSRWGKSHQTLEVICCFNHLLKSNFIYFALVQSNHIFPFLATLFQDDIKHDDLFRPKSNMLFFSSLSQHVTKIFGPDFLVPCVSLCLRLNSFFPSYNDVNELPVLYESDNAINWNKFILTSNDIPGYSLLSINQFFLLLVHSDLFQDRCKYLLSCFPAEFFSAISSHIFSLYSFENNSGINILRSPVAINHISNLIYEFECHEIFEILFSDWNLIVHLFTFFVAHIISPKSNELAHMDSSVKSFVTFSTSLLELLSIFGRLVHDSSIKECAINFVIALFSVIRDGEGVSLSESSLLYTNVPYSDLSPVHLIFKTARKLFPADNILDIDTLLLVFLRHFLFEQPFILLLVKSRFLQIFSDSSFCLFLMESYDNLMQDLNGVSRALQLYRVIQQFMSHEKVKICFKDLFSNGRVFTAAAVSFFKSLNSFLDSSIGRDVLNIYFGSSVLTFSIFTKGSSLRSILENPDIWEILVNPLTAQEFSSGSIFRYLFSSNMLKATASTLFNSLKSKIQNSVPENISHSRIALIQKLFSAINSFFSSNRNASDNATLYTKSHL